MYIFIYIRALIHAHIHIYMYMNISTHVYMGIKIMRTPIQNLRWAQGHSLPLFIFVLRPNPDLI